MAERVAAEVEKALRSPDVLRRYGAISAEIPPAPREFPRFVEAEKVRWKKLVAQRGITTDAL